MPLRSPVPSRAAMLTGSAGDPFLGALIGGLGAIGRKLIPLAVRGIGRIFRGKPKPTPRIPGGGLTTGVLATRPESRSAAISRIGSSILRGGVTGLSAAAIGSQLIDVARAPAGMTRAEAIAAGLAPKRRRMNVLNPKALRRATRRLSGFNRMAKKTQKELAKLAPPRARRHVHDHHRDHHHK